MPRTRARGVDRAGPDAMLRCRTYGHSWDEFYPDDLDRPATGWRLSLRCVRCAAERHDVIGRLGSIEGRRYVYPDGYRLAKAERLDRAEYRQALYSVIKNRLALSSRLSNGRGR